MQIDAASYAEQLAYYEIYSAETRYTTKLSTVQSQSSMISKIDSALDALDNILYKFTKPTGSFAQSAVSLSSEDYFSVDAAGYAKNVNMDLFVEQTATAQQTVIDTSATSGSDVFATVGKPGETSFTFNIDGTDVVIDLADIASEGQDVTYQQLVNYINQNDELDGKVNASLIRSDGQMKLLFSSEETGEANAFTLTATSNDAEIQNSFDAQNTVKEARDAIIWLGEQGSGIMLTNSSNTFEDIVEGVDITINKANSIGDDTTNLTIGPDSDATIELLNEFITAFNEVLSIIDEATQSGNSTDGEERGVLASDSSVRSIANDLKNVLRTNVNGVSMFEIGLSFNKEGKLELDEDAFKDAADEYDLEELFLGDNGMFRTLETTVEKYADYNTGSLQRKKERLTQEQERINDKLEQIDTKYEMYYNRYLAQFTNLNNIMYQMESITTLFA